MIDSLAKASKERKRFLDWRWENPEDPDYRPHYYPKNAIKTRPRQGQLELFEERLPAKPYCSDDLEWGLRIRPKKTAIRKAYVQANPPWAVAWLIFDVDREGAGLAWEDAHLPVPAWVTINRENGHAHLAYGLDAPVLTGEAARRHPIRYLAGIQSAFRAALEADPGYSGLITKNPANDAAWKVLWGPARMRTLGELAEWVDLPKHLPKRRAPLEGQGLGRNCALFDDLRMQAYKEIRHYRCEVRNFVLWQTHIYNLGMTRNGDFSHPLDHREVHHLAKSVSKWVWGRFDIEASDQRFQALQAARGHKGGLKSGEVRRQGSIAEAQPWEAEGVSRRTWFRRKSGLIVPS